MNAEPQEVAIREPEQLTAKEVRSQVNLVQEVMKAVMQRGTHYGTIPGCGEKPTLLKPGAEKLAATFRLAINPEVTDMSGKDVARYRVRAVITHQITGAFLGAGVGECSSAEEKYCWRNAVCKEEFEDTAEDRKRKKWRKAYGKIESVLQVRTNPADIANTVLKMSKKRALIDGILTVTGASDIFTQDIEDMPEELLQRHPEKPKESPQKPADEPPPFDDLPATPPADQPTAPATPDPNGKLIDAAQVKRMWTIARKAGFNDAEVRAELERMGIKSSKDVTKESYEDICTHLAQGRR